MTIKPKVLAAMDRMCTPLDESVLCGATADADARNMALICTELHRLDKELEAANAEIVRLNHLWDMMTNLAVKQRKELEASNTLLEIIRTGKNGKKYDYVEACDGHMVLVADHLQGAGDAE